jgi:hypothetical protein
MPPGAEAITPPPEGIPPEAMAQTGGIPAMASERDLQKQAEELERHFAILPPAWQHAIVKEAAEQQKAWFDKLPEDQKKVVLEKAAAEQFEALKQVVRDFRTGKLK